MASVPTNYAGVEGGGGERRPIYGISGIPASVAKKGRIVTEQGECCRGEGVEGGVGTVVIMGEAGRTAKSSE